MTDPPYGAKLPLLQVICPDLGGVRADRGRPPRPPHSCPPLAVAAVSRLAKRPRQRASPELSDHGRAVEQ